MARIMIAEDSREIMMFLQDVLEIEKHDLVAKSFDGQDTIERFKETSPDLLLLDFAMPRKDGLSVLNEIMKINPKAKVILITASGNLKAIQECIKAGASMYLLKPFKMDDLTHAIKTLLTN